MESKNLLLIFVLAFLLLSCGPNPGHTPLKEAKSEFADKAEPVQPSPFTVNMAMEPGVALPNKPVKINLTVNNSSGNLVPIMDIVHEKPMHLLLVSNDLAFFNHIHPELTMFGSYSIETQFPSPGKYLLFLDYTPKGTNRQVSRLEIDVAGEPRPPIELFPDTQLTKTVDNLQITLQPNKPLRSNDPVMLDFKIEDARTGRPVTDLEPYLGAFAHFIMISRNTREFLHAHPLEKEGAQHGGPEIIANTIFPVPGLYKIWAQFQRGGKVITADFVVNVAEGPRQSPAVEAKMEKDIQKIRVTVSERGYEPSNLQLKQGVPAQITFYREDANNCGDQVIFPDLGIKKDLPVGQNVSIEFTPEKGGTHSFSCGMGMLHGSLVITQ